MTGARPPRLALAVALLAMACASFSPGPRAATPQYDLFLKSDYGLSRVWIDTRTGDFRWEDRDHRLDLTGRGALAFPNLGPVIFTFAGSLPGYDWVSISLKIYHTSATGYLAAFPEGTAVRKVVSNFYDRNTRDDREEPPAPKRRPEHPKPPEVGPIHPHPTEVPDRPG